MLKIVNLTTLTKRTELCHSKGALAPPDPQADRTPKFPTHFHP